MYYFLQYIFLLPWNEPVPTWYSAGCRLKLFAILASQEHFLLSPFRLMPLLENILIPSTSAQ